MSQSQDDTRRFEDEAAAEETSARDVETHATTGGAAAAGAVTGGVIGLAGGPAGAAIGAVGGAIIGAAAERLMHGEDDDERTRAAEVDEDTASPTTRVAGPTMRAAPAEERVERADVDTGTPPS
jgi:outer membrane lipoprotein SlyB